MVACDNAPAMSDEHASDPNPSEAPEEPVTSAHEAAADDGAPAGHESDAPGHADAVAHHAIDDHGDDHGHDDHGHGDGDALGPVDGVAWGAGLVGGIAGLIVVAGIVLAPMDVRPPV